MAKRYNWKRYWIRRGGSALLDGTGFLSDPAAPLGFNPDATTWEKVSSHQCAVLLGEPGIGKSIALEQAGITSDSENRIYLNLKVFADQKLLNERLFGSPIFQRWLGSTDSIEIVLDSLDECLLHIKTVATWIAEEFGRLETSRIYLRIACRTAEWPEFLDEALQNFWKKEDIGFYELAPLREADVLAATVQESLDATAFLSAIYRSGVGPLAANPNTLTMLLGEFAASNTLPKDPVDLYRRGCRHLCANQRTPSVHGEERLAIAERLAASMIFGRKSSLHVGADVTGCQPDALTFEEAVGPDVCGGKDFDVTPEAILDVSRTALFNGRAPGHVGFAHWTYSEFLAARFCITRQLSLEQISQLIFHPESGSRPQVIPQLGETAAWIAAMSPEFLERVADCDPVILLRSSVLTMSPEARSAVVRSILDLADRGEFFDSGEIWRRVRYDVLKHPGLHDQLQQYIENTKKNTVVRRIAMRLAEVCEVKTLSATLAERALDRSEDLHARDNAARAVAMLGDDSSCSSLRPLLELLPSEDPNDQLRGNAFRALWPKHLDADALFRALTLEQRSNFTGAYAFFLNYELPDMLQKEHLAAALGWVDRMLNSTQPWHHDGQLANKIFAKAFANLDDPAICEPFIRIALRRLQKYEHVFNKRLSRDEDPLENNSADRRRLVRALIPAFVEPANRFEHIHSTQLQLDATDFPWLLEELKSEPVLDRKAVLVALLAGVFDQQLQDHVDQILEACKSEPVLAGSFAWLIQPVELGSERALKLKSYWDESRRRETDFKPKLTHPPIPELARKWLDLAENGNVDAWWKLHHDLMIRPESDFRDLNDFQPDVKLFPGWATLTDDLKKRCIDTAERVILTADPKNERWIGNGVIYRPAFAAYRAFHLLLDERPKSLTQLDASLWAKWAGIIIGFPHSLGSDDDSPARRLAQMAYSVAPESVLSAYGKLLRRENRQSKRLFLPRIFETCWDRRMSLWLLAFIRRNRSMAPEAIGDAYEHLLRHDPDATIGPAIRLVRRYRSSESARVTAVRVAAELLNETPSQILTKIWPLLQADDSFARDVLTRLASDYRQDHGAKIATLIPEDSAADLFLLARRLFPLEEDPEDNSAGGHFVGSREQAATFRDAILSRLRDRGTKKAVHAIKRIASQSPDLSWLAYTALLAERARLTLAWTAVPITTVVGMARDRVARPLESSSQLLHAVIDSLKRLERKLHGPTPAVVYLWNGNKPRNENDLSDYVKLHLEDDLRPLGIIAHREAEVRRGQETDIYVDAIAINPKGDRPLRLSIVIEVKGCWHRNLKDALRTQLKNRYLKEHPVGCGLYLVGWFVCDKWRDEHRKRSSPKWTIHEAREFFEASATDASDDQVTINSFVLDLGLRNA